MTSPTPVLRHRRSPRPATRRRRPPRLIPLHPRAAPPRYSSCSPVPGSSRTPCLTPLCTQRLRRVAPDELAPFRLRVAPAGEVRRCIAPSRIAPAGRARAGCARALPWCRLDPGKHDLRGLSLNLVHGTGHFLPRAGALPWRRHALLWRHYALPLAPSHPLAWVCVRPALLIFTTDASRRSFWCAVRRSSRSK